jgi:hypothetical protein
VANTTKVYGQDAGASLSGTIAGILNNDSVTATYNSPGAAPSAGVAEGPYSINANLSDNGTGALANYAVTINTGILTVSQDSTSLDGSSSTNPTTYGQSITLTATLSGDAPASGTPTGSVDFYDTTTATDLGSASIANGSASLSTTALPAGNQIITLTYSGDGNFMPSNGAISQVVNPDTLTVTADNASMLYGASLPSFTDTITGFVNGDDPGVVSGSASLSTTATSTSPPGTYPIAAALGTLSAANYTFIFQNGTLTILPVLIVTAPGSQAAGQGLAQSFNLGSFSEGGSGSNPWNVDVSWGDSSADTTFPVSAQGSLGNQAHTYTTAGTFTVTVTVQDNAGSSGSATYQVTVYALPTAGISGPSDGVLYQPRNFTFTANAASGDAAAGFTYQINWGDGSPVQVIQPTPNNTTITQAHTYTSTGTVPVSVTVVDQFGGTSLPASQNMTVGLAVVEADTSGQGGITGLAIAGIAGSQGVLLTTGTGANVISVTRGGSKLGSFTATGGNVAIYGDGGTDILTVNGVSTSANTFTLTGSTASFTAASLAPNVFTIALNSLSRVTFAGGKSGNAFTVTTPTVASVLQAASGGANTFTLTGASLGAAVAIHGAGTTNTVTGPTLAGSQANVWTINSTNSGNINGSNWTFSGIQNLVGGTNGDQFQVAGAGSISGTVNGNGAAATLDYSGYMAAPVSVNLTTSKATGIGGTWSSVSYFIGSTTTASTLTGASGNTTWNLTGANSGTANAFSFSGFGNLNGGSGTDTFTLGTAGSLTGTLNGHGGTSTLAGPNLPNTFNITSSNAGNLTNSTGVLNFTAIQSLTGGAQPNDFVFSAGVSISGSLSGGTGGATLDLSHYTTNVSANLTTGKATGVGGTASGIVALVGGSGTNTLTGPAGTNTWTLAGANAGNLNGSLTFTAFANLNGGSGTNYFVFADQQGVTGKITGGSGVNRLDYTAYSTGIYVNLRTRVATGTGGISGIQQVYGGQGNDILVGTGSGIVLQDLAGNNLIIGGSGQATIDSGSDQDIVIAGTTKYDTNASALAAIEAYWSDTSIPEATRVAQLSGSGTPTGHYKLNPSTVTHATASDTLVLGSANDWLFWRQFGIDADNLTGTPDFSTLI